MGNTSLLLVLASMLLSAWLLLSAQQRSLDGTSVQRDWQTDLLAREHAEAARRLVLTAWTEARGTLARAPFDTLRHGGGELRVSKFALGAHDVLDFTVQGVQGASVHEVRSRYRWDAFRLNPLQIRASQLHPRVAPGATLAMDHVLLDDQGVTDLERILIDELGLAENLAGLGVGMQAMATGLTQQLEAQGLSDVDVVTLDDALRARYEDQPGALTPKQVEDAVSRYRLEHPASVQTLAGPAAFRGAFGLDGHVHVVVVPGDVTLAGDVTGRGVLVVEGDLVVPEGRRFDWDGLVLVRPPPHALDARVDFSGEVDLRGGLVALHDPIPNTGHMDFTVWRDYSGLWTNAWGHEGSYYGSRFKPWLQHTHDFSSKYGNQVVFHNEGGPAPHDAQARFAETLRALRGRRVRLELYHPHHDGQALLSVQRAGQDTTRQVAAAGFDSTLAATAYRSVSFRAQELAYLDLTITRLPYLKKLFDQPEPYPGCPTNDGPVCVGYAADRREAFALRLYEVDGSTEKKVYEASLYWHRRLDEREEFQEEMETLIRTIRQDDAYGLTLNLGARARITADAPLVASLAALRTLGRSGPVLLGVWHRHWEPDDLDNPLRSGR